MKKLKKIERFFDYYLKKFFEYPLKELKDQIVEEKLNQKIPSNVYQTWENNFFGKSHYNEIIKFRKLNKNLSFILFNKEKRDQYMFDYWSHHEIYKIYKSAKLGVMQADIFRFCILNERGGYYFDISKGCKIPLDQLHTEDKEVLISNEPVECVIPPDKKIFDKLLHPHLFFHSWGMAFIKNHPITSKMIEKIVEDYPFYVDKVFEKPKTAVLSLTATGQFTKIVREYFLENEVNSVEQSGIFFNGHGIFSMKGCRVRHHQVRPYADLRDEKVF